MSGLVNTRIIYSILFYILLIILIIIAKPSLMFDEDGHLKTFGIGEEKTMFSLGVLTVILALLSFYIFCLIDLVFANKNVHRI